MDWQSAFLEQARSDYRMLALLKSNRDAEMCHKLYYLRTSLEKFVKSKLAQRDRSSPPKTVHPVIVDYLRVARRQLPRRRRRTMSGRAWYNYVDDLLPYAQQIEELAPESSCRKRNVEYPWRPGMTGDVQTPARHGFADLMGAMAALEAYLKGELESAS